MALEVGSEVALEMVLGHVPFCEANGLHLWLQHAHARTPGPSCGDIGSLTFAPERSLGRWVFVLR